MGFSRVNYEIRFVMSFWVQISVQAQVHMKIAGDYSKWMFLPKTYPKISNRGQPNTKPSPTLYQFLINDNHPLDRFRSVAPPAAASSVARSARSARLLRLLRSFTWWNSEKTTAEIPPENDHNMSERDIIYHMYIYILYYTIYIILIYFTLFSYSII